MDRFILSSTSQHWFKRGNLTANRQQSRRLPTSYFTQQTRDEVTPLETNNAQLWNLLIFPDWQINFIWKANGNHLCLNCLKWVLLFVRPKYLIMVTTFASWVQVHHYPSLNLSFLRDGLMFPSCRDVEFKPMNCLNAHFFSPSLLFLTPFSSEAEPGTRMTGFTAFTINSLRTNKTMLTYRQVAHRHTCTCERTMCSSHCASEKDRCSFSVS